MIATIFIIIIEFVAIINITILLNFSSFVMVTMKIMMIVYSMLLPPVQHPM